MLAGYVASIYSLEVTSLHPRFAKLNLGCHLHVQMARSDNALETGRRLFGMASSDSLITRVKSIGIQGRPRFETRCREWGFCNFGSMPAAQLCHQIGDSHGVDLLTLEELLRHSNIAMTIRYAISSGTTCGEQLSC